MAIAAETSARVAADGHMAGSYTVRVNLTEGGRTVMGGFGLMGTSGGTAGPTIDFGVRADKFWIGAPSGETGVGDILPFIVQANDTVINGVEIPKGVYMDAAFIVNLTAMIARLGEAWIDNAMIDELDAIKLTVGNGTVGGNLRSTVFNSTQGWQIEPGGNAYFRNAVVSGTVYASAGTFSGDISASTGNFRGQITGGSFTGWGWPAAGLSGFYLGSSGLLLGNANDNRYVQITASGDLYAPGFQIVSGVATFSGTLNAPSGTFGTVTAGLLRNAPDTARINLNATGSQDFLSVNGGAIRLTVDGDAFFAKIIASGTWTGSKELVQVRFIDEFEWVYDTPLVEWYIDTGYTIQWGDPAARSMSARLGDWTTTYSAPAEPDGSLVGVMALSAEVCISNPIFDAPYEEIGQNPYGPLRAGVWLRVRAQITNRDDKISHILTSLQWTLDAIA